MTEQQTPKPFNVEGYFQDAAHNEKHRKKPSRKRSVEHRRNAVLKLLFKKMSPREIREELGLTYAKVTYDMQVLRKKGLIPRKLRYKGRRFEPTHKERQFIIEELRKGKSQQKISKQLELRDYIINNYVRRQIRKGDEEIIYTLTKGKPPPPKEKPKPHQLKEEEKIKATFGLSGEEMSRRNMLCFYGPEIQFLIQGDLKKARRELGETGIKNLRKYGLVKPTSDKITDLCLEMIKERNPE